jgi:hypothetical protein
MVRGPREFVPDVFTKVVERRQQIPLDTNEGVYVRNTTTGQIRRFVNYVVLGSLCQIKYSPLPFFVFVGLQERFGIVVIYTS